MLSAGDHWADPVPVCWRYACEKTNFVLRTPIPVSYNVYEGNYAVTIYNLTSYGCWLHLHAEMSDIMMTFDSARIKPYKRFLNRT